MNEKARYGGCCPGAQIHGPSSQGGAGNGRGSMTTESERAALLRLVDERLAAAPEGPKEVTVEDLSQFLLKRSTDYAAWSDHTARALLSKFTITPKVQS